LSPGTTTPNRPSVQRPARSSNPPCLWCQPRSRTCPRCTRCWRGAGTTRSRPSGTTEATRPSRPNAQAAKFHHLRPR
jgi:hypothetical protein